MTKDIIWPALSAKSTMIFKTFDNASQAWGWEQDQGSDPKSIKKKSKNYIKAKQRLLDRISELEYK